jgi:hypothetical protein
MEQKANHQEAPQHIAVPVAIWHALIELLMSEMPMKKAEGYVTELRKCKPVSLTAPIEDSEG